MVWNFLKALVSSTRYNSICMEHKHVAFKKDFSLLNMSVLLYLQLFGTKQQMKTSCDRACVSLDINTFLWGMGSIVNGVLEGSQFAYDE